MFTLLINVLFLPENTNTELDCSPSLLLNNQVKIHPKFPPFTFTLHRCFVPCPFKNGCRYAPFSGMPGLQPKKACRRNPPAESSISEGSIPRWIPSVGHSGFINVSLTGRTKHHSEQMSDIFWSSDHKQKETFRGRGVNT